MFIEKLTSICFHTKSIVEKVFSSKGFTAEETALFYYWPKIVGDRYAAMFSIANIETIETTLSTPIKRLHIETKQRLNPIEAGYCVQDLKEKICSYFGFEMIHDIKIKKGKS